MEETQQLMLWTMKSTVQQVNTVNNHPFLQLLLNKQCSWRQVKLVGGSKKDRIRQMGLLEHLVQQRSPELNQMVHQYVLHLRHHKYHIRMQRWLLAQQQPKHQAHLLAVNVVK